MYHDDDGDWEGAKINDFLCPCVIGAGIVSLGFWSIFVSKCFGIITLSWTAILGWAFIGILLTAIIVCIAQGG